MSTNQIGLEKAELTPAIKALNALLSSYHLFYINVRGYHWNVKGEHFFTLHPKFEELYTELQLQIDEIAERILTLGGTLACLMVVLVFWAWLRDYKPSLKSNVPLLRLPNQHLTKVLLIS